MEHKCQVHDCQAEVIQAEVIQDLEKRVRQVEAQKLAYNEKFIILFQKLDDIHNTFKKLIFGVSATGIAFIIWYIQSIGK